MNTTQKSGRRISLWWLLPVAGIAAVVAVWAWLTTQSTYLGSAARDPVFIRCGAISLACLVGLLVIGRFLLRAGRSGRAARGRSLAADSEGIAILEFVLLLPVAVAIVLIMIQAMLMMSATILVNYAAFAAARTAIVWVPKDLSGDVPIKYDPEPENFVAIGTNSRKLVMIRAAAANALLPLAGRQKTASTEDAQAAAEVTDGIREYFQAFGGTPAPNWVSMLAQEKFIYALRNTEVELLEYVTNERRMRSVSDAHPGGKLYGETEDVVVKVTHKYELGVPFAAALFATDKTNYTSPLVGSCTLPNEGASDTIQEDQFDTGNP